MPYINPFSVGTRKRKVFDNEEETPLFDNPSNIDFSNPSTINAKPKPLKQGGGTFGLANILQAIASGIGVGISNDPGAALIQQLSQQRQQQMQAAELAAQERRAELESFNRKQLESMRIEAQKSITGLELASRRQLQQDEINAKKELANLGFKNDADRQQAQFDNQEKIAKLNQTFQMEVINDNQAAAIELEKTKAAGDINQVLAKTTLGSLLHANTNTRYVKGARIPMETISTIVAKISEGKIGELTKQETEAIDQAFKTQEASQAAAIRLGGRSGGLGGRGSNSKIDTMQRQNYLDREKDRRDLASGVLLRSTMPMIDPETKKPMLDIQGQPIMQPASGAELGKRVQEVLDMYDAVNPIPQLQNFNQNTRPTVAPQDMVQATVNAQIDQNWGTFTPQAMHKIIDDNQELNPAQKRQAKAYINSKTAGIGKGTRLKGLNPFGR